MNIGRVNSTTLLLGAATLAIVYAWLRGFKGVASDVSQFVVKSAEGAIIGIGQAVGIPETDVEKCAALVASGNWWDASFYCPAGTFFKSATGAVLDTDTGETVGYTEPGQNEFISISDMGPMP